MIVEANIDTLKLALGTLIQSQSCDFLILVDGVEQQLVSGNS